MRATAARFWSHVTKGLDCWTWTGKIDRHGYGQSSLEGKSVLAHRRAYELVNGPIPNGLVIDHTCRNRACVNPDHLEPVTFHENVLRAYRTQTNCKRGHALTPDNTRMYGPLLTKRWCRACDVVRHRKSVSL